MKKILLPILSVLLILTGCNGTKKFDQTMSLAFKKAQEVTVLSAVVCDKTSRTWRNAIYDYEDHKGHYCSDFNTALYRLAQDLEEKGTLDEIRNAKKELNDYAKAMAECPKNRKDAYNDFIDYVTDINSLADLATDPEGNLNSYNSNTNDLVGRIKKAKDSFELKYGDSLVDVEDEKQSFSNDEDW